MTEDPAIVLRQIIRTIERRLAELGEDDGEERSALQEELRC